MGLNLAEALWSVSDLIHPLSSMEMELITAEETVVLKGITAAEVLCSPCGVVKGVLKVTVKRRCVPLDSISIRLIGECMDSAFIKTVNKRRMVHTKVRCVDDAFEYTTEDKKLMRGVYVIPFQFFVDSHTPETLESIHGRRRFHLEVWLSSKATMYPMMTFKEITIKRLPADDSVHISDSLETLGNWQGVLPFAIRLSSKVCRLGEKISIGFESLPDPSLQYTGVLESIQVKLVQRVKVPELDPTGHPLGSYVVFPSEEVLMFDNFAGKEQPYISTEKTWDLQLPVSQCGYNPFHAYTSNHPLSDDIRHEQIRITHSLIITLGFQLFTRAAPCSTNALPLSHPPLTKLGSEASTSSRRSSASLSSSSGTSYLEKFDLEKLTETTTDAVFRAPIFIVSGDESNNHPPPSYDELQKTEEDVVPKSFAWLCSNGKFEVEHPPLYVA